MAQRNGREYRYRLWLEHGMGQIVIPGYTLKRKLGQGGMAVVFLAVQESFGREVALKLLLPSRAREGDFAERFLREARVVAQLSHPSIIVVHDVGQTGDLHYFAMAYHSGGDLTQRIRSGGVSVPDALNIARQIADALAHAHSQGIVHRDLKPDNILFRDGIESDDKRVVITDFGIAKSLHDNAQQLTQAGSTVGTPKYMSPEQARGQRLDGRSDLYSLGCLLFEMLTGAAPYLAQEAVTLAIKHCQDPIPRLPQGLDRLQPLMDSLLAKEAVDRPSDAQEVVAMIDELQQRPQQTATFSARAMSRASENTDATVVLPTFNPPPASATNKPVKTKPYKAFFRHEEMESGGFFSKRYALKAAFSCEDYEEFQRQYQRLQDRLQEWLSTRQKRATRLELAIQAHPWILGRVKDSLRPERNSNTPLGALMTQAEITLHLYDELDPNGETLTLSETKS